MGPFTRKSKLEQALTTLSHTSGWTENKKVCNLRQNINAQIDEVLSYGLQFQNRDSKLRKEIHKMIIKELESFANEANIPVEFVEKRTLFSGWKSKKGP